MKRLLLALACFSLAACQSTPAVYNPSGIATNELAELSTKSVGFFENEVQAMIVGVYDPDGKQLIGYTSPLSADRWKTVYLDSGVYTIVAICMLGNSYSHPRAVVAIDAGAKYTYSCLTEYKKNFLGLEQPDKSTLVFKKI